MSAKTDESDEPEDYGSGYTAYPFAYSFRGTRDLPLRESYYVIRVAIELAKFSGHKDVGKELDNAVALFWAAHNKIMKSGHDRKMKIARRREDWAIREAVMHDRPPSHKCASFKAIVSKNPDDEAMFTTDDGLRKFLRRFITGGCAERGEPTTPEGINQQANKILHQAKAGKVTEREVADWKAFNKKKLRVKAAGKGEKSRSKKAS